MKQGFDSGWMTSDLRGQMRLKVHEAGWELLGCCSRPRLPWMHKPLIVDHGRHLIGKHYTSCYPASVSVWIRIISMFVPSCSHDRYDS